METPPVPCATRKFLAKPRTGIAVSLCLYPQPINGVLSVRLKTLSPSPLSTAQELLLAYTKGWEGIRVRYVTDDDLVGLALLRKL